MMALAEHTGRGAAHDLVYDACRAALEKGATLLDELKRRPDVTRHLDGKRLAQLTDPINYLGSAPAMVDRALAARRPGAPQPARKSRARKSSS